MRIALICFKRITENNPDLSSNEDAELKKYLENNNCVVSCPDWKDESVTWENFDVVIIKSPWDYHEHINQFHSWLIKLERLSVKVLNPIEIIRWNSNKLYLKDIKNAGLPVISSIYLKKKSDSNLSELFHILETTQIIIKPCVSASAKNTIRVMIDNFAEEQAEVTRLLKFEDFIAQPFMNEIFDGEWSLIFFNGKYSHSVLKVPQKNDFRVQQHYGGSYSLKVPEPHYIERAQKYVSKFAPKTLYARVDGLIVNGEFVLMELELIEPFLFFNSNISSFERYYNGLLSLLRSHKT